MENLTIPRIITFDGVNNDKKYILYDLEKCTGISLDELSIIANNIKKVSRR